MNKRTTQGDRANDGGTNSAAVDVSLGTLIQTARRKLALKQVELARLLGFTNSYISKIESDDQIPGRKQIAMIAQTLQADVEQLMQAWEHSNKIRSETRKQLNAAKILDSGMQAISIEEVRIGREILADPLLDDAVCSLRQIKTDPELLQVAVDLLRTLATRSKVGFK